MPPLENLVYLAITTAVGIIAYFLRRTISDVDTNTSDIKEIKERYATKDSIKSVETKLDDIKKDLNEVQVNYIPKSDFMAEMDKIDRKLDRMTEIIIDQYKERKEP